MSDVFFEQLGIPEPDVNLGVGSGSHAGQTAALLLALEAEFIANPPRAVVVYGDVNSTLAATLVAAKLGIPIVHVEAGLRSFDRAMPEEINRVVVDARADLLLVTSPEGVEHLAREGVAAERIALVGNPMIDTLLKNLDRMNPEAARPLHGWPDRYAVVTLHRPSNVDDPKLAREIVDQLLQLSASIPLVIPLHPRGAERLGALGLVDSTAASKQIKILAPLGYIEFSSLVRGATLVVTDSGGVQEETTILKVPCLTMRENTERPITITHGTNRLVSPAQLAVAASEVLGGKFTLPSEAPPLWDGEAGVRIAALINARYHP
jgi:UDP-N-acetylglucosamine 2-epimerase (non-hydrolysing)